jgi:very-short-patch-repair endonuclease
MQARKIYITGVMAKNETAHLTNIYLAQLHQGARALTRHYAKELRHRQTEAEEKLWSFLRNRQLKGKKFRRQHAIAGYIVDFYCNESKVVIELDGNFHANDQSKEYDASRTASLKALGITVLRFWNQEVMKDSAKVLRKIAAHLD